MLYVGGIKIKKQYAQLMRKFLMSTVIITIALVSSAFLLSAYQNSEELFNNRQYTNAFVSRINSETTVYTDKKLFSVKDKALIQTAKNTVFVIPGIISPAFFLIDNFICKW